MKRLEGCIALVTGAASGIGRATAKLFAEEGARVYLADVNGAGAETAAGELVKAGLAAQPIAADVSLGQDVSAMFRVVERGHGRLDVLVNNAGLNVRSDFRHLSDADWAKIREVNLDGVVRVARDGFALLKASGRGSLINVASIMAHRGLRQLTAYSATKGAVTALTRGLAVEYAPFGIRVNALCPGFVHTPLTARVLRNSAIEKALVESTALRRLGEPEEIARAALFLASDEASYITGAELAVDGGMSAAL
ncbi:MAG TPA: SDR family oxidoreductase [Hyphomicrobiaceae bacterium]|jgi:NAD(P)-dependent dehydrogenase (short-subunit alcohol dehydrogenase family)|nr:SDR family oxidoreductase [Hyphomicrobiaceae bacterium]